MLYSTLVFALVGTASAVKVVKTKFATAFVYVDQHGNRLYPQNPTKARDEKPKTTSPVIISLATPLSSVATTTSVIVAVEETPVASTTSIYVEPVVTTAPVTTSVYIEPVVETTTSVEAYVETTSSTYVYVEPTTSTTEAAAAETTTSDNTSNLSELAQEILSYHNQVRAEHDADALTWSDDLANYASSYLASASCNFAHSGGPYGENLAWGYSSYYDAQAAWYNEYTEYDFAAGEFSSATGHFTQMVWKSTTQIGCAAVDCSGSTYLVCEYNPAGNVIGQFTENVSE